MEKRTETFEQLIERGCGLDVHEKTVMATVRGTGLKQETREFRTFTNDLKKLKQWLRKMLVKHVAIESTGVYWKPIFNILGDEFEIILVNARHVKNVPGRKTDVKDSEWLAKLLISGLLKASFIPPKNIRELRDLTRYQGKLINQVSAEKNRLHKVLEDCNIKLSSVVSDIQGSSARKIINALVYENYKPEELLQFVHGRVKASREDIKEALTGEISEHHKFLLKTILDNIKKIEGTIDELDNRIAIYIKPFEAEVELLKEISGVGEKGAIGIISEIGADMKQFPNEQHLAKWAGMCPGNNETGGKKKSGRITYGNKYLRALLVQLAWAASRTKGTYLSSKYKSLVGRRGKKRAVIAVGHKILIAVYFMLRDKVKYNDLGAEYLQSRRKDKIIKHYINQLGILGLTMEDLVKEFEEVEI